MHDHVQRVGREIGQKCLVLRDFYINPQPRLFLHLGSTNQQEIPPSDLLPKNFLLDPNPPFFNHAALACTVPHGFSFPPRFHSHARSHYVLDRVGSKSEYGYEVVSTSDEMAVSKI